MAAIRSAVQTNNLVPGQRLVEAELCEMLGATRHDVHSALVDLSHEGLVEWIANRGPRVRIVGLEEALQIAEARLALESLCVEKAAQNITDDDIVVLRDLARQLQEQADAGNPRGFAEFRDRIFDTYIRIADHAVAAEALMRLRTRGAHNRFMLTYRVGWAQLAAPYWQALVEAICQRDPAAAKRALRRHSLNVQAEMKALTEEKSSLGAAPVDLAQGRPAGGKGRKAPA
jgi:DNA-binding GntR family transcriptional regulator